MKGVPGGEVEKTKVDLAEEKTEAEWLGIGDKFFLKATPLWFEWLEWVLILGVLTFVAEQTRSLLMSIVCGVSYFALFSYLQGVFYSIKFYGFPWVKSERIRRTVSIIVSGVLSYTVFRLLMRLVSEVRGKV